jgi:hypothetical protein
MFIGHFAVGFAAKKYAPRASLAVLLAAPLFSDLLWSTLLLLGWERVHISSGNTKLAWLDLVYYPWSHSLLMCGVWAAAFAVTYYRITHYSRGTTAIWLGVMSHWVLDWITHRPDMPLYPGGPRLGLGLWNSVPWTMVVEIALFGLGVWFYVCATGARDHIGQYAFPAYVALLFVSYVCDLFSKPSASVSEIAWPGLIGGIFMLLWAWWFDRHRAIRELAA